MRLEEDIQVINFTSENFNVIKVFILKSSKKKYHPAHKYKSSKYP